jgi:predicted ATPase
MKFTLKNLGIFEKETTIELGDLTIICGNNNTGKTYASYAIFGFLDIRNKKFSFDIPEDKLQKLYRDGSIQLDLNDFAQTIDKVLDNLSTAYTKSLPKIFSTHEDFFNKTHFKAFSSLDNYQKKPFDRVVTTVDKKGILKFNKHENSSILQISLLIENKESIPSLSMIKHFTNLNIGRILFRNIYPKPFIISSERAGVSLFHQELNINKNVLFERLQNSDKPLKMTDYFDMIDEATSRYALPIKEGIDFVRDIIDIHSKKKSQLIKEHPEFLKLIQEVIGGEYKVENNQILFAFRKNRRKERIPIYMASSAVKSLLALYFYIISIAKKGDILMIDEPELNLHPANQRKLARLFARLVKVGIKVFITTHSDYLIKELNNLIMLSNEFEYKDDVLKTLKYSPEDNLHPAHIKVYVAENKSLSLAPITEYGIEVKSFDKEIAAINHAFNEITLAMGI